MKGLRVRNLTAKAGKKTLLQEVDFDLFPGEVLGLIGPNGAGKTTLVRHLTGYLSSPGVQILVDGEPLESLGPKQRARKIAWVPQSVPQALDYTLEELVSLGRFPWQPDTGDRELVRRCLRYVGLDHVAAQSYPTLSGGEKQKGLFARALVQESPYLLLDEPASSLDPGSAQQLFEMLGELAKEGRGILVVLHDLNVAAQYCDRLVVLSKGRVEAQGTPAQVLDAQMLQGLFGIRVRMGMNEITGRPLLLPQYRSAPLLGRRIHLIGGGGSAVNLTRHLARLGWTVTGGVVHQGDSDGELWNLLGVESVRTQAFSPVSDKDLDAALTLADNAELTVLCHFPFGPGNVGNLELAAKVKKLVVITQDEPRWFAPGLEEKFRGVLDMPGVRVMTEASFVQELEGLTSGGLSCQIPGREPEPGA